MQLFRLQQPHHHGSTLTCQLTASASEEPCLSDHRPWASLVCASAVPARRFRSVWGFGRGVHYGLRAHDLVRFERSALDGSTACLHIRWVIHHLIDQSASTWNGKKSEASWPFVTARSLTRFRSICSISSRGRQW